MKVKIKLLHPLAEVPKKAYEHDAGFDLKAVSVSRDDYGNAVYGTGVSVRIPNGYVGLLFQRSSVAKKSQILSNAVGVVDAGSLGEITFKFRHLVDVRKSAARPYEIGERIGQLIIMPIPSIDFVEVNDLGDSERGTGNYGSSGK